MQSGVTGVPHSMFGILPEVLKCVQMKAAQLATLAAKEMTIVGADTHVAGGAIMVHVQHCLILQTVAFVLQKVTDNK